MNSPHPVDPDADSQPLPVDTPLSPSADQHEGQDRDHESYEEGFEPL
ncbi:hypothetical protein OG345_03290 [Streptomyces sp. NBC_01220]|nr:hypothetical protein [Streptomyces sp. NBC_01358]WSQ42097.1 hypothetical protein OG345_03290 [Streptomyces sp. NBC_01220]